MSKIYTASTLTRKARPRSEKLLGTTAVIANGPSREVSGLTATQLKLLKDLADWFGYDEDTHSVYVKKDAQGLPRNFYTFGDLAGGGVEAQSQGDSADVQWSQLVTSGTKIATITINGVTTDVYAPAGGSGGSSVSWGASGAGYVHLAVDGDSRRLITAHQDISNKITSPNTSGATGKFLQWDGSAYTFANQTWRAVKIDGVSLIAGNSNTALNLKAGDNITLTGDVSGGVTIKSTLTWRAVKIDGVSLIAGDSNTALNIKAGENITLTGDASGGVTIKSAGLTHEQSTAIANFISWFGMDSSGAIYIKKDAQGNARNFYGFGEVAGGGIATAGGGGGTGNYDSLLNRPKIAGHTLTGDMSLESLGIAAANHSHSQYLTSSALNAYLPKTGGTLTGRLTINDASSTKPLILNTTATGATSVRTDFQVDGTQVGYFEYGLDSAWLKLFISDGKGNGYGITGLNGGNNESRYGKLVAVKNVGTGWATYEFWHAGNSGDYAYDWKCKVLYTAGHIVPHAAETYAVGIGSAPFAEVHANRWYPNKNDTAHYIEYIDGHWLIHGDAVCTGDLAASHITA